MRDPIDLYYWPTPNGWKITIALAEMHLPYRLNLVNIGAGEQFRPEFLALSPNNRMPAIVDPDGPDGKPVSVFDSGAILQYLARKTGRFHGTTERDRIEVDQIEFDDSEIAIAAGGVTVRATVVEGIRAMFMGLALLGSIAVFFFIMRSMASTLDPSKISMKSEQEFEKRILKEEETPVESERDAVVKKIIKTSSINPEIAAKTLKAFFKEE